MDRAAAKAVVDREIEGLMGRLGVPHWRVKVAYGRISGDEAGVVHGQCTRLYDYNTATIELDPEALEDEAHALRVLRHELFHVVLSPFDLFGVAVDEAGLGKPLRDVLDRVWRHSCEKACINLERMYQGLTAREESRCPSSHSSSP